MAKIDIRKVWPACIALALSILLASAARFGTKATRVSTLDLGGEGFAEIYLEPTGDKGSTGQIVERGDSTLRRGDPTPSSTLWSLQRVRSEDTDQPWDGWLARSDEGTVFFLPVSEIPDWTYPFVHEFVRRKRKSLELPRIEWTVLHVNRVYQGLYLRVPMPFDVAKPGETRRELLLVRDDRMMNVDSRFEPLPGEPKGALADAELPELESPPAPLAWLSTVRSTDESSLVLSGIPPYELKLLPLPFSMAEVYAAVHGRPPTFRTDARFRSWNESWRPVPPAPAFFDEDERFELASEFEAYRILFLDSLRAHGELYRTSSTLREQLPLRQSSAAALGLQLGDS